MTGYITEDTPFGPEDDSYHVPTTDDPDWVETNWWCFNIPGRHIGCWLHAGYHAHRNQVTVRVFAWDPSGADPGRLAYYKKMPNLPMPAGADLRDITFPGPGYTVRMLEPLMRYRVAYADLEESFAVEFEHHGVHPPQRFTPGEAPAMHNPHLDQLGHITGEMTLRGERLAIDCYSVRDRTWGPRRAHDGAARPEDRARAASRVRHPGGPRWREIERERGQGRIQYIFGHAEDGQTGFLSFVRPSEGTADGWSPMNVGWLLRDGEFRRLDRAKSRMRVSRDPVTGWSQHMEVRCEDRTGRAMEAEGWSVSHMCETGAGSNALMRWEAEGTVLWGEDQDGWSLRHFRRMRNALRDRGPGR
jgi:hypothetical protein